ncbi:energy transducer TonB [Exilibacterium tricleocarpae]|nr:energy transducer TonB [Exilibacterium tricleocarpae]
MSVYLSSLPAGLKATPISAWSPSGHYSHYRLIAMLPVSALVTLLLFYLMHRLVFVEEVVVDEPPTQSIKPFFMEEKVIETHKEKPPERPQENDPPPTIIEPDRIKPPLIDDGSLFTGGPGSVNPEIPTINIGGGSLVRQVGVAPQYPRSMLARGVEGFVDLEFDVTAYGATTNIRILQSQPEGAFDRAAVKAVQRWKYKPRYVEEEAVASYNIRERIRFVIEGS